MFVSKIGQHIISCFDVRAIYGYLIHKIYKLHTFISVLKTDIY